MRLGGRRPIAQALMEIPVPSPVAATGEVAIRARGLTKRYGTRAAVDAIDFEVPTGVIAGPVGPNGSGKTTTIRMLLSFVAPTAGSAEVLGAPVTRPGDYLPRVGALIEGPAFHWWLSGRRNLEILAALGGIPAARVDEVLEVVQLADRAGDRVLGYSLGMKQRLGIAAALLPRPELLERRRTVWLLVPERPDQLDRLATLLAAAGHDASRHDGHVRVDGLQGRAAALNRLAMEGGIVLDEITQVRSNLEETFLAITDGGVA
jgi:ABC-type transport system involved in cytochrome c biogenesis ATPase subunit